MEQEVEKLPGRLAFRIEGQMWNAYWALPDTMKGAIFLGSIRMTFVENRKRKDAFFNLMKACFADTCEEIFGVRPIFPEEPVPAPEHEKGGNA